MSSDPQSWEFEPGYEPVFLITAADGTRHAVGKREGVLRVEAQGDRALHFDPAGRVIVVQAEGKSYRRTLDQRILTRRVLRSAGRRRGWERVPPPEDSLAFLVQVHEEAAALLSMVEQGAELRPLRGAVEDPLAWLRRSLAEPASWNRARIEKDLAEWRSLYLPIPILPPDQYSSLVLQLTEGCAWNRCGFCDFYRGTPYRERGLEEFLRHVDGVLEHLGGTLSRLRRVFLGQANALLVDNDKLLPMLESVVERLPVLPLDLDREGRRRFQERNPIWVDGLYSFVDGFHRQKSTADYRALAELGLRRVYLGLESGSDEVLQLLGKPPATAAAIQLVHSLRAAGIRVGVILLIGAGGRAYAQRHLDDTLQALRRLQLQRGDQVYLSRLVVHEGGPYEDRARHDGIEALERREQDAQLAAFSAAIRQELVQGVAIAPYEIDLSRSVVALAGR